MKKRQWLTALFLVVFGASQLLISGCGTQTQSNSPGSSAGEASQNVKEIKIGGPYPLTGNWAEGGNNSKQGMEMAIEDVNAAGGIKALGGAKLVGVFKDTSSTDPAQSASATRGLIQNDKVSALIGAYVSALSLTATTEAEKAGVPIITQSYVDQLTERGYKTTFQIPPTSSSLGKATMEYLAQITKASETKVDSIVFATNNDANSMSSIESAKKQATELGLKVADVITYPVGITDAMPVITKIKNANAGVIVMAGTLPDEILLIKGLRAAGVNLPIVGLGGGGILGTGFPQALGKDSDYVLSVSAWNWDLPYDGLKDVADRYKERYKVPFMPQEAGESYVAVWVLKEAIEAAKSSDPAAIRDAIAKMDLSSGKATMMVGGKMAFDEKGRDKYAVPIMIEYKDGLPHTVWPKEVQTMEPILK